METIEKYIAPQPTLPIEPQVHLTEEEAKELTKQLNALPETQVIGGLNGVHKITDRPANIFSAVIGALIAKHNSDTEAEIDNIAKLAVKITNRCVDELNRDIAIKKA